MRDKEKHREACRRWAKENPKKAAKKALDHYYRHREKILAKRRALYAADPSKRKAEVDSYQKRNREKVLAKLREYSKKNRSARIITGREYYAANAERLRKMSRDWAKQNPEKARLRSLRREVRERGSYHAQADEAAMAKLYSLAKVLARETGVRHEVDHIIPLAKGGWHHQDNMQVLPYHTNTRKSDNPFWEMVGFKSWRDVPQELWPESLRAAYTVRMDI